MPVTETSILVTPFRASISAIPPAAGIRLVPFRSIFVEPPPTWYPTALVDLLTRPEAGALCWDISAAIPIEKQSIAKIKITQTRFMSRSFLKATAPKQQSFVCVIIIQQQRCGHLYFMVNSKIRIPIAIPIPIASIVRPFWEMH
jgi:hypothetical protein